MVLDSGSEPVFFYNPIAEPFMPYLDKLSAFIPTFYHASTPSTFTSKELGISSAELSRAWEMTQTFCSLLNYASDAGRKIPQETYLNSMASVMYRLVHLRFPLGSLDELLRLGLLGFCSHTFLQWSLVKVPHRYLSAAFKACLLSFADPIPLRTLLWLLTVGSFAIAADDESDWLLEKLRMTSNACGITSWSTARTTLKMFLWVDFLHDDLGMKMLESVRHIHG